MMSLPVGTETQRPSARRAVGGVSSRVLKCKKGAARGPAPSRNSEKLLMLANITATHSQDW
ncbi:hypothetical protein EYF80_054925 [Liparis tanakae]|uniref:Uncharacterized protein n=1 Tax=Liparis tanakae TaxID=230148 RepID=A0A4Z2F340_9TELE|nr:hypothetical protein EYF80_054925 [Liparis tanakae]